MAVPKKRTGHSAQGKRRSNWKATKPTLTTCPNCGQKVLAHTVCTACGTYKGKAVSKKGQAAEPVVEKKKATKAAVEEKQEEKVEEVKETKKRTRKSTKKAEEAPAVEEKAEEKVEEEKTEE